MINLQALKSAILGMKTGEVIYIRIEYDIKRYPLYEKEVAFRKIRRVTKRGENDTYYEYTAHLSKARDGWFSESCFYDSQMNESTLVNEMIEYDPAVTHIIAKWSNNLDEVLV